MAIQMFGPTTATYSVTIGSSFLGSVGGGIGAIQGQTMNQAINTAYTAAYRTYNWGGSFVSQNITIDTPRRNLTKLSTEDITGLENSD